MSDNPNKIVPVLLNQANPQLQQQLLQMVKEQKDTHELQKDHRCWSFVLSLAECEKLKPFQQAPDYDRCPKCKKGRVILEFYHGNIGSCINAVCRWGEKDCGFSVEISGADDW
jgi:hypothetical protein